MKDMWDQRYAREDYAYGKAPNEFFRSCLNGYPITGHILMPAEGEGRNAVYAAKRGLQVTAFDISEEGRKKALRLAEAEGVSLRYEVGDFLGMDFEDNGFDAIGLIFAHFTPDIAPGYHAKLIRLLKPGGWIVLEVFATSNLPLREQNPRIGGPARLDMLFDLPRIRREFPDIAPLLLEEVEEGLSEGEFHQGVARLVRLVGRKRG